MVSKEINEISEIDNSAPSKINAQVRNREEINSACLIYFLSLNLGNLLKANPAINESTRGLIDATTNGEKLFFKNPLKKIKTRLRRTENTNNTNKQSNGQH